MTPVWKRRISKKSLAALGLVLVVAGYAFYRTAEFRGGPALLLNPAVSPTADNRLYLSGQALRIAHLALNHNPIFTDAAGHFNELFLLAPGSNIIRLSADDRFGRQTEKLIQIIYVPDQKTSERS
jgi:hypothetical protein